MSNFIAAWDATNRRYLAQTKDAIDATFKRRHESEHVRNACKSNIIFYKKHFPKVNA